MLSKKTMRVALFGALLLAGCTTLDHLDKKSDELLDDLNNPSSSSSRSSSSGSSGTSSGLKVVQRTGMTVQNVQDAGGNNVPIYGQTGSSSNTPGHDTTMEKKALEMAQSGKYEYITLQRSWRTATNRVSKSGSIPDIIGVRHNGKVDAIEVKSKTDREDVLRTRLKEGMQTLPAKHRGEIFVIIPDS